MPMPTNPRSARMFTKGRGFAVWLGLVPKQIPTGDRTILARYPGVAIVTCGFCSCRQRGLC
jgi:transposase